MKVDIEKFINADIKTIKCLRIITLILLNFGCIAYVFCYYIISGGTIETYVAILLGCLVGLASIWIIAITNIFIYWWNQTLNRLLGKEDN